MTTKAELDRQVAMETGNSVRSTTETTTLFLQKIIEAIASGEELRIQKFGRFRLTRTGGAMPRHKWAKGTDHTDAGSSKNTSDEHTPRFRVQFAKSETLTRAIREKQHGKVRR